MVLSLRESFFMLVLKNRSWVGEGGAEEDGWTDRRHGRVSLGGLSCCKHQKLLRREISTARDSEILDGGKLGGD